jgi:transposase-like protein
VCDTELSRELVSKVTDAVLGEMNAWQSRPLDPVYPMILIEAIVLKVREGTVANRPMYVAMGITIDHDSRSELSLERKPTACPRGQYDAVLP